MAVAWSGSASRRIFALPPLFDPQEGTTVIEPLQSGRGWWAGACSVLFDEEAQRFYLYYRIRKPRELGRGTHCRIAVSDDGIRFNTIWEATKEQFDSPSIEKASLVKTPDGKWRLYISFVSGDDNKWRIELMEAESPDALDPSKRVKVLAPDDVNVEGVKDPYVFFIGGCTYMLMSYAPRPPKMTPELEQRMHETGDVYNTGLTKSSSALAISSDGVHFMWIGDVFSPRDEGWDAYASRLSSLLYQPPVFIAFYDGSATVAENYEEKTGIAFTFDLRHYERVTTDGPILTSPHASHSLRYLDAVDMGDEVFYYYEYAREDGSHELRMNRVQRCG